MSLSDPLGDMLTRIRNGQMRGKESVIMPASRFRGNVLDVLQREGYIKGFKKVEIETCKNEFKIELKYVDGEPVIKNISEFQLLEEESIQKLKICKETSTDLVYQFYQLQKGYYLIMKQELKMSVERFYAKFSNWTV